MRPAPVSFIEICDATWRAPPCGSARDRSIPSSWQSPDFDAIKPRYTVGLGPERDLARAGKGAVGRGEQLLGVKRDREQLRAVKLDREPLTLRPQSEPVPLVGRDLGVGTFDLLAPALDHTIEADVVFERIGTHDIIVIGIADPDGDAAGL